MDTAAETQRRADEAAAEWARREAERLAEIDQKAADAAAAREARRVEEAAAAAETQRRADEAAASAAAETQRRADEAAAEWEARGTTAGDSTEQDRIDQGIFEFPTSETDPVETVTVANPYFDPNADDMGDGTDLKATVEVAKSSVTSRPSLPTVLVDNPYFDPYGDDTGDGFDQKATDRVSIRSARTEGIDFGDEDFYDAGFQNPLVPQVQSEPVRSSADVWGDLRDRQSNPEPVLTSADVWSDLRDRQSNTERMAVDNPFVKAATGDTPISDLPQVIYYDGQEITLDDFIKANMGGHITGGRTPEQRARNEAKALAAVMSDFAVAMEQGRLSTTAPDPDAVVVAVEEIRPRYPSPKGYGYSETPEQYQRYLDERQEKISGAQSKGHEVSVVPHSQGATIGDVANIALPGYSYFTTESAVTKDGGLYTPDSRKAVTIDGLLSGLDLLPLPVGAAAKGSLRGARVLLPKRLGGGVVPEATSFNKVAKINTGASQGALDASLDLRNQVATTGSGQVVVGGKLVSLQGDRLDEALRRANPEATLTYHGTPDAHKIAGGGVVPDFPAKAANEQFQFLSVGGVNPNFTKGSAFGAKGTNPGILVYDTPVNKLGVPGSPTDPGGVKFYHGRELELGIPSGDTGQMLRSVGDAGPSGGSQLYLPDTLKAPNTIDRLRANTMATVDALRGSKRTGVKVGDLPVSADVDDLARRVYGDEAVQGGLTPNQSAYINAAKLDTPELLARADVDPIARQVLNERGQLDEITDILGRETRPDRVSTTSSRVSPVLEGALRPEPFQPEIDDAVEFGSTRDDDYDDPGDYDDPILERPPIRVGEDPILDRPPIRVDEDTIIDRPPIRVGEDPIFDRPPIRVDEDTIIDRPPIRVDEDTILDRPPIRVDEDPIFDRPPIRVDEDTIIDRPPIRVDEDTIIDRPPIRVDEDTILDRPPIRVDEDTIIDRPPIRVDEDPIFDRPPIRVDEDPIFDRPPIRVDEDTIIDRPPIRVDEDTIFDRPPIRVDEDTYLLDRPPIRVDEDPSLTVRLSGLTRTLSLTVRPSGLTTTRIIENVRLPPPTPGHHRRHRPG